MEKQELREIWKITRFKIALSWPSKFKYAKKNWKCAKLKKKLYEGGGGQLKMGLKRDKRVLGLSR